jgi:hydroxypyruvate isomerase
MPRFSANLGFLWPELPLLERIAAAGRSGFKAVELHFPYATPAADVRNACADAGVVLLGINTAMGSRPGDSGLAAVPGRESEARELIDQAFAYVAEAGGTAVHVMAGKVTPEQRPLARDTFLAALRHAAGRAAHHRLVGLLEPINQRDMPGYFYSSVEEAVALINEIGSDRLKLMFDCYHVGVMQGDVLTRLATHMPQIGHVQFAAVPSRAEPDEGELNYPAIFAAIDRLGYTGWVGAEYRPRASTEAGLGWLR